MVMKADILDHAVKSVRTDNAWLIYLSPQGRILDQAKARDLAEKPHLVLLCGHYEGIDARVLQTVDEEISIGDYVLTGGEMPAMILVDTVARLIPGVLGGEQSGHLIISEHATTGDGVLTALQLAARVAAATRSRLPGSSATPVISSRTWRLPWMIVRRLLKSWAMPPLSWPMLSRRCE